MPSSASGLTRPATGPATPSPAAGGLKADPPTKAVSTPGEPGSVFAKYLTIAHLEADALLTVDPEPWANAEKVTRAASIQDPGAIE